MNAKLKVLPEIKSAIFEAKVFSENYSELIATLNHISGLFENQKWRGDSATTAQEIHNLIIKYVNEFQTAAPVLQTATQRLCDDVDAFSGKSINVASIRGI